MRAIGIHTFAGLFTEGVKDVFDVIAVVNDGYGDAVHKANHPGVPLLSTRDFKASEYKDIDFVFAQPPCAPWSVAGAGLGFDDPRLVMSTKASEIALALEPSVFVLETVVRGYTKGKAYYDTLASSWESNGYSVTHMLINGAYLGTPQNRNRYLFIAHRHNLVVPELQAITTVANALESIEPGGCDYASPTAMKAIEKYGYGEIRQGTMLKQWFTEVNKTPEYDSRGYMVGRPGMTTRRLVANEPAPVVIGDSTWLHPTEDRPITMNELKALCGVRSDYTLLHYGRGEGASLLGRSVMPATGRWIAGMAKQTVLRSNNTTTESFIDVRKPSTQYELCI